MNLNSHVNIFNLYQTASASLKDCAPNVLIVSGCKRMRSASFKEVTFEKKKINFNDVVLKRNTSFNSSQFNGDAFFENTTIQGKLSLTKTKYGKSFISWYNIIGGLVYDDAAYMSLMKSFKDLGYFEDYDSCYFAYRKAHRDQDWPEVSGWEQFIIIRRFLLPMKLYLCI
jgi:hypothetical protein